jgi:hypothetical protein
MYCFWKFGNLCILYWRDRDSRRYICFFKLRRALRVKIVHGWIDGRTLVVSFVFVSSASWSIGMFDVCTILKGRFSTGTWVLGVLTFDFDVEKNTGSTGQGCERKTLGCLCLRCYVCIIIVFRNSCWILLCCAFRRRTCICLSLFCIFLPGMRPHEMVSVVFRIVARERNMAVCLCGLEKGR